MIKEEKGITLIALVITIAVILIIASITVPMSLERFEVNNVNKMISDLEVLKEEVSNYYIQHGKLPILEANKYNKSQLKFETDAGDNNNYYIIDLTAIGNISLNYGRKGYENPGDDDVYIINEATRTIYYVKGIELDGEKYYRIEDAGRVIDNVEPSSPKIKIISGLEKEDVGKPPFYITAVEFEIVPGKDNWSGIKETTYSIKKDGVEISTGSISSSEEWKIVKVSENGTYIITAKSVDNNNNISKEIISEEVEVHVKHEWSIWEVTTEASCIKRGVKERFCTNIRCGVYETVDAGYGPHGATYENNLKAVNCKAKDKTQYICSLCNTILSEKTGNNGPHVWGTTNYSEGNCIRRAKYSRTCTLCSTVESTEGAYGDHSYGYDWISIGRPYVHKVVHKCAWCGDKWMDDKYGWHVPPNLSSSCSGWPCEYCRQTVMSSVTSNDVINIRYMWGNGVDAYGSSAYPWYWSEKGVSEEEIEYDEYYS